MDPNYPVLTVPIVTDASVDKGAPWWPQGEVLICW